MAKVVLCGGFGSVDSVAELDDIQVYFHDAALAPESLYHQGVVGLEGFAEHGAGVRQESIFGRLLADGTAAAEAFATLVLLGGYLHLLHVEAVMVKEETVLGINDSGDEVRRDGVEGHVVALEVDGAVAVKGLLEETLHHQGCERRIEEVA